MIPPAYLESSGVGERTVSLPPRRQWRRGRRWRCLHTSKTVPCTLLVSYHTGRLFLQSAHVRIYTPL
jgi:hypothetical protein